MVRLLAEQYESVVTPLSDGVPLLTVFKRREVTRPAEAAAKPPAEGKGGLKQYRRTRTSGV
jgi:hypothetical protein